MCDDDDSDEPVFPQEKAKSFLFFSPFHFYFPSQIPALLTSCPSGGRCGEVEGKRREEKRRCHKNPLLTSFQAFPFTCRFGEIRPPPSSRSFRFSLFLLFISARRRLAWSKTAVARMPVLVRTTLRVFLSVCIFFSLYGVGSFSYFLFLPLWWKGFSWSGGSMSCRAVQGETGQVFLGGKIPPRTCVRSRTQRKGESWLLLSWVPFSMLVCLAPTGFLFATQRTVADRESESGA